jgi:UDP-N-acetylmuramyl tripeptide synthase
MKKSIIVILIGVATAGVLFFIFKNNNQPSTAQVSDNLISKTQKSEEKQPAEKIEVVHFHATQQCWSCITVGEYALKTIKEKFPEEYKNGTIVFKDINGELPKNKDIVIKYQAGGSSLFVNAITNGKDNIEEDVTVWRLVVNEGQFINYFQNKLSKLLGK